MANLSQNQRITHGGENREINSGAILRLGVGPLKWKCTGGKWGETSLRNNSPKSDHLEQLRRVVLRTAADVYNYSPSQLPPLPHILFLNERARAPPRPACFFCFAEKLVIIFARKAKRVG